MVKPKYLNKCKHGNNHENMGEEGWKNKKRTKRKAGRRLPDPPIRLHNYSGSVTLENGGIGMRGSAGDYLDAGLKDGYGERKMRRGRCDRLRCPIHLCCWLVWMCGRVPSRDIEIAFNKPLLNSLAILLLDYFLGWVSCEWVSVSRAKNHPKYARTTRINTK